MMTNDVILCVCDECDGWTILDPAELVAKGVEKALVKKLTKTLESNFSSPKTTLYVDGQPVNQLRGVVSLDLLWAFAARLDVDTDEAEGKRNRGRQAEILKAAIRAKLTKDAAPWRDRAVDILNGLLQPGTAECDAAEAAFWRLILIADYHASQERGGLESNVCALPTIA